MRRRTQILLYIAAMSAALCSCAKEIVMDAREEPVVAVECVLTQQPVQTLRLSFTKSVSMSEAPALTEAEAVLIDLTEGKTVGNFERQDDGTWALGYTPIPEHSYRLEVDVPGQEPIWAEQTMPNNPIIMMNSGESVPYGRGYRCFDIPGQNHIWLWAMKYNPETRRREYVEHLCTDWPNVDNFNLTGELYEPPTADTTFYGTPAPSRLYPMLEGTTLHKRFLRLDLSKTEESEEFNFIISGDFEGKFFYINLFAPSPVDWHEEPHDDEGYLAAAVISTDYDSYLRDATYFKILEESSDLSSIYIRDNIFSNIHGGLGIFGAYTVKYLEWAYGYAPEGYDQNQP